MHISIDVTEEYKEVYATFGLAVYLAQCFERQLAITLSTVCSFNPQAVLQSQYDDLLSRNFKKTMGQLLHKIKEGITVPDELTTEIEEALKRRNFLMHTYFWERAVQLSTSAGRKAMIHELQDACVSNVNYLGPPYGNYFCRFLRLDLRRFLLKLSMMVGFGSTIALDLHHI
jgi:hypothetical protein